MTLSCQSTSGSQSQSLHDRQLAIAYSLSAIHVTTHQNSTSIHHCHKALPPHYRLLRLEGPDEPRGSCDVNEHIFPSPSSSIETASFCVSSSCLHSFTTRLARHSWHVKRMVFYHWSGLCTSGRRGRHLLLCSKGLYFRFKFS